MKATETFMVRAARAWGRGMNLFWLIRVEISVFPMAWGEHPVASARSPSLSSHHSDSGHSLRAYLDLADSPGGRADSAHVALAAGGRVAAVRSSDAH